jgi:hypothetical protein
VAKSKYKMIRMPDHPRAWRNGFVPEHIVIAEDMIQRPIAEYECVHHINGDHKDNHPDNLIVLAEKLHVTLHARLRAGRKPRCRCGQDLLPNMDVCAFCYDEELRHLAREVE